MVSHLRRLLPLNRLRELDISALDKSVGGGVVAIVWQEVVVELPEHVEGDSSIWRLDAVVGLAEHLVKLIEGEVFRKQLVGESVHFDQSL